MQKCFWKKEICAKAKAVVLTMLIPHFHGDQHESMPFYSYHAYIV